MHNVVMNNQKNETKVPRLLISLLGADYQEAIVPDLAIHIEWQ